MAKSSGSSGGDRKSGGEKKLGRDPLAWMKDDTEQPSAPEEASAAGAPTEAQGEEPAAAPAHQQVAQTQSDSGESTMASSDQKRTITVDREEYIEYYRAKKAMHTATTAFLMTNPDGTIHYVNEPMQAMLARHEAQIVAVNPGFTSRDLEDRLSLFDLFPQLRSVAGQMQRIRDDALHQELHVGELRFNVYITGEDDEEGNFLGNTLEWFDITEDWHRRDNEKKAQRDVEALIERIQAGELSHRVETSDMSEGFIRTLSEDINMVLDVTQAPVREVIRVMELVSKGDLTQQMQGEFKGDFGQLQDWVNSTIDVLRRTVDSVRETANGIASASSEIAQGNQDLSQRTEEQASSLEETASSIEELTSTVKQTADNARESNQLATSARERAERGQDISGQVVEAMGAIKQSSREISDIITVIDEIAFQTNLLALNAAVEAARAGEHGRGFGVVAAEVRNLAQRSATAAKDIKKLINDSGEKVEDGTRLVNESNETLKEILEAVQTVTDKVAEISAASEEQSSGIDEINKAVSQLDEVTQQNAALVEEAASAAESLDEQSDNLVELMSFFGGGEETPKGGGAKTNRSGHAGQKSGQATGQAKGQAGGGARAGQSGSRTGTGAGGQRTSGSGGQQRTSGTSQQRRSTAGNGGGRRTASTEVNDGEWEEF